LAANTINVGTNPNDGSGDALRTAMQKINAMFAEQYSSASVNTQLTVGNSTVNTLITNASLIVQNTSVTAFNANTTGTYVAPNILNVGTPTKAANGFTYITNSIKINWGWVSANDSTGNATFTSAFSTIPYVVMATSSNSGATYTASVISQNSTTAVIRTANTTAANVYYIALGV